MLERGSLERLHCSAAGNGRSSHQACCWLLIWSHGVRDVEAAPIGISWRPTRKAGHVIVYMSLEIGEILTLASRHIVAADKKLNCRYSMTKHILCDVLMFSCSLLPSPYAGLCYGLMKSCSAIHTYIHTQNIKELEEIIEPQSCSLKASAVPAPTSSGFLDVETTQTVDSVVR
jgi:hypothetical protein